MHVGDGGGVLHRAQEPGVNQNLKDAGENGSDLGQDAVCLWVVCCSSLGLGLHTWYLPMREENGSVGSTPELSFQV